MSEEKKSTNFSEGIERRGGLNERPAEARPNIVPAPQKPVVAPTPPPPAPGTNNTSNEKE